MSEVRSLPDSLVAYCLAGLLGSFRKDLQSVGFVEHNRVTELRDELLLRWAASKSVQTIARNLWQYPHQVQSTLARLQETTSGRLSGQIDARSSIFTQLITGDPSAFVVQTAERSYDSPRNRLLVWILNEAARRLRAGIRRHGNDNILAEQLVITEHARHNGHLRDLIRRPGVDRRPALIEIRDAARSLSPLYQEAVAALTLFEQIEAGSEPAIEGLLREELTTRLEDWQHLELATCLAAAEAFSLALGEPFEWTGSLSSGSSVLTVGPLSIVWQRVLASRDDESLSATEKLVKEILDTFGLKPPASRVDVSILDADTGKCLTLLECKYSAQSHPGNSAIADAVMQVIRYCRDTASQDNVEAKDIRNSSVVVVGTLDNSTSTMQGVSGVSLTDFAGLRDGLLHQWAERVVERRRQMATV